MGAMKQQKRLIVANWKMNPATHTESSEIFKGIKEVAATLQNVQTVVCPPFVFIDKLAQEYTGERILFGGQDVFYEEKGSYSGEVSPAQLYSVGADYVIIGHSERRRLGETDEDVSKKVKIALTHNLTPIMCVGESERDSHGKYLTFLREQITRGLSLLKRADISRVVIAYEPIWAIGKTGADAITPQKLHETTLYIRRVLREAYANTIAEKALVLYGGSVEPANAETLLKEGDVSGFLVGHASLDPYAFKIILNIANQAQ